MPILKLYDESTEQWVLIPTLKGEPGPQGATGSQGPKGDTATEFYYGATEPTDLDIKFWFNPIGTNQIHEIPYGGTTGQFLAKTSNDDYAAGWTSLLIISNTDIDTIMEG